MPILSLAANTATPLSKFSTSSILLAPVLQWVTRRAIIVKETPLLIVVDCTVIDSTRCQRNAKDENSCPHFFHFRQCSIVQGIFGHSKSRANHLIVGYLQRPHNLY